MRKTWAFFWYPNLRKFEKNLKQSDRAPLKELVAVDEANLTTAGSVNSQNVRDYAPKGNTPNDFVYHRPNDRRKVAVLAAVTGNNNLIGPIFIEGNLNGDGYLNIINQHLQPVLWHIFQQHGNGAICRACFFQDGKLLHRSTAFRNSFQIGSLD